MIKKNNSRCSRSRRILKISKVDPIKNNKYIDIEFPTIPKFDQLDCHISDRGPSAFLTIQEGCDKFCTFCVVPYTRGVEYSRPSTSIIDEAKKLVDAGVREITLLGQNVNAWNAVGKDKNIWGLGRLIEELAKINELKFIRYTTSHPLDMDIELIEAHRDIDKLMPYLHLPVQSGSDKVLKMMNRNIREKAVEKTYSELGRIRDKIKLRKEKTGIKSIVAVAGCIAQAQGKEIMKRSPWVDIL